MAVYSRRQEDGKASELTELQRVVSEAAERQRIELAEVSRGVDACGCFWLFDLSHIYSIYVY